MDRLTLSLATLLTCAALPAFAACGSEPYCEIDGGRYQIALPEPQEGKIPAVMFLHGHGGTSEGVLKMQEMVQSFTKAGYAVIAPDGMPRPNGPQSWSFREGSSSRDDFAFLPAVLVDAGARFNLDTEHSVLAGFSAGAFMVNYLACKEPQAFSAYLPISGGFWRPQPESCAGPVRMYHSHGWSDETVPLEGRMLGQGRFIQGDIWAGLELWRETFACETPAPNRIWQQEDLMLREWSCGEGSLRFELFPGGHKVPNGWADRVLDWLALQRLKG